MLASGNRLSRTDFSVAFSKGRRVHTTIGTLIYTPGDRFHGSVVVSKKVSKKAVVRNRLRRQVYGQLYTSLKQTGWVGTVIVLLKPTIATLPHNMRLTAIRQLIEQVPKPAYNSPHV